VSDDGNPTQRVRVTSPRTSGRRSRRLAPRSEIDQRTRLGEIYVSSLLRAQLRLALGVLAVVIGAIAALPLLFRLAPTLFRQLVLGVPLSWAVLAFFVYPFLFVGGWFYVRRAERNERDFASVVQPSGGDGPAPDGVGEVERP